VKRHPFTAIETPLSFVLSQNLQVRLFWKPLPWSPKPRRMYLAQGNALPVQMQVNVTRAASRRKTEHSGFHGSRVSNQGIYASCSQVLRQADNGDVLEVRDNENHTFTRKLTLLIARRRANVRRDVVLIEVSPDEGWAMMTLSSPVSS
jgi:hypothetical protein